MGKYDGLYKIIIRLISLVEVNVNSSYILISLVGVNINMFFTPTDENISLFCMPTGDKDLITLILTEDSLILIQQLFIIINIFLADYDVLDYNYYNYKLIFMQIDVVNLIYFNLT